MELFAALKAVLPDADLLGMATHVDDVDLPAETIVALSERLSSNVVAVVNAHGVVELPGDLASLSGGSAGGPSSSSAAAATGTGGGGGVSTAGAGIGSSSSSSGHGGGVVKDAPSSASIITPAVGASGSVLMNGGGNSSALSSAVSAVSEEPQRCARSR